MSRKRHFYWRDRHNKVVFGSFLQQLAQKPIEIWFRVRYTSDIVAVRVTEAGGYICFQIGGSLYFY